jgi:transposase
MTKFSEELKAKVIQERLSGKTFKTISEKFGIEQTSISRWVSRYEAGGIDQLLRVNRQYTPEFKKKVIEYRWEHGLSLIQTAAQFKIPNSSIVYQWERNYLERGMSGLLSKKKGRPSKMPKKPKKKEDLTKLEKLEAENAQLRMENEFLKKLDALVQQRKKQPKKN